MANMIKSVGLNNVTYQNLSFGIACIHHAKK
jgi:ubiquinone/menaquinone biosynthesis C-methylase UbiE